MPAAWMEDLRILVRILRRDHDGVERHLRVRQTPADDLIDFAVRHRLSLPLWRALGDSPARDAFSADRLASLAHGCGRLVERSHTLLAELERLSDRFRDADQPFMILKGHYLAARFYDGAHAREFRDLDVLVPHGD